MIKFLKAVALLFSVLGSIWLYIQLGRFLHENLSFGPDLLFWALYTSFLLNLGLVAYLFDTWRSSGGGNTPPAPQP